MALMSRLRAARAALGTRISHESSAPVAGVPESVAIIMDGNGRWARRRRLPTAAGHRAGAKALRRVGGRERDELVDAPGEVQSARVLRRFEHAHHAVGQGHAGECIERHRGTFAARTWSCLRL